MRVTQAGWVGCLLAISLLVGCGGEKVYHLTGTVTFKGQPIPEGYIVFEPDGSQGNQGQSGKGAIRDGRFSTRGEEGMPIIGGPHVIRVVAHSAPFNLDTAVGGEVVMPDLLFPPYTFKQDLPFANSEANFDIPPEAAKR